MRDIMMEFSETERSIIQNMMATKSHKEIAFMVDRNIEDVAAFIKKLCAETGLPARQQKLDDKRKHRPDKVSLKKLEKKSEAALLNREQKERNRQERRRINHEKEKERIENEQRFETKKEDYSNKVMVKVDRNTYIYAERGKEQQARNEYLNRY